MGFSIVTGAWPYSPEIFQNLPRVTGTIFGGARAVFVRSFVAADYELVLTVGVFNAGVVLDDAGAVPFSRGTKK